MLGSSATSPADTVVQGNLLVKGGITAASSIAPSGNITGDLTVGGTTTLNGPVVAGATVVAAGQITANAGLAVSAGNLAVAATSNLGVVNSGALTVTGTGSFSSLLTATGGVTASSTVTAPVFANSSAAAITVKIINAGVPIAGVVAGPSGAGNNILAMSMSTIIPGSASFKAYKVFLSGSATDKYASFFLITSGGTGGAYQGQFQGVSGLVFPTLNYKGNVTEVGTNVGTGGGLTGVFPDNVIVCPADLVSNTLYYCGNNSGTNTLGTNDAGVNIWLTFVPIL
jgi:hypothetical protein